MVYTNYIVPVLVLLIGAMVSYMAYKKGFKKNDGMKTFLVILGVASLVVGAMGTYSVYTGTAVPILGSTFLTTVTTQNVGGTSTTVVTTKSDTEPLIIDTVKASTKTKYANSYTTVAGTVNFYDKDANPGDPNTNAIDTITLSSGVGSSTNALLKTNTPYRITFDGDGTYYDKDLGVKEITNLQKATGTASVDLGEILTVATIDDMINESAVNGDVNGQSVATVGTAELGSNATDYFWYDESVGDQQFYIQPTLSASTANTGLKNPVLCFDFDRTNPPEGTEVTAISQQVVSGTDFGLPSDLTSYWTNQQCVSLGSEMKAGTSSKIKLTFTVDESALDNGADVWYMEFDDLGSYQGQDIHHDTGGTGDSITFNSQA